MCTYPEKVTLEEGLQLLLPHVDRVSEEIIPIEESNGRVLAANIISGENIPPFDRSPYDGYALRAADIAGASKEAPVQLSVIEEVPAGSTASREIREGEAIKILTGSPVPEGATAIVKFEDTLFTEETVTISAPSKEGCNIVPAGEDVKEGELVIEKGRLLSPALVGLLAGLGHRTVQVYRRLTAAILSTGDELVGVEEALAPGKIRNSSIYTLHAYLEQWNVSTRMAGIAKDNAGEIAANMKKALSGSDLLITTGGVSVGDYDLVKEALIQIGAKILFWKVRLKPGMAFIAAIYQGKPILALSGNPSAAAVSLLLFGRPLIRKMSGMENYQTKELLVKTAEAFPKKSPSRRMIPGTLEILDGEAWIVFAKKQGNGMLNPLRDCELLGEIEAGSPSLPRGSIIKAYSIFDH